MAKVTHIIKDNTNQISTESFGLGFDDEQTAELHMKAKTRDVHGFMINFPGIISPLLWGVDIEFTEESSQTGVEITKKWWQQRVKQVVS